MRLVLFLLVITQVFGLGEKLNKNIVVAPVIDSCKNKFVPNCEKPTAFAKVDADHYPSDYQCPCKLSNTGDGTNGGIDGATGIPVQDNEDADFFVDEAIASGFDNPVAVGFADNGRNMFVGERGGRIWNVDLVAETQVIFRDLSEEVGFSGDRGLMDLKVHPNYDNVGDILVMFTTDSTPTDGKEPDAESAQNQKIVRLGPGGYYKAIIGGGLKEGKYADGVPICFNTHALGEMAFAQDGSLMVSTGEGAHWNFDMGDWGQDADGRIDPNFGNKTESLDAQCAQVFGPAQDIGSWRSQVLNSLAGKILRITPDTGRGICNGSVETYQYTVKNPYCQEPDLGESDRSKVWARGLRNPFRMTMRPFNPLRDSGPGVFYFGDVGQGGYEEVNAVTGPGMNFGWPCWEGPLPSPMMRDSGFNDDGGLIFAKGCGGSAEVVAPCRNITTVAYDDYGVRLTCPRMYKNMTTNLPFMYWTRFRANDNAGYFTENAYTGQGFFGATTAGLAFYSGSKYPEKYRGKLFALDFTEKWVKVITLQDDQYVSIMNFAELIYSNPTTGAKVTLASGPDGNICYLTLNGGEVRCFRYVETNVAPVPMPSAVENGFNAENQAVQFQSDGTSDRESDEIVFIWDFDDGSKSNLANPVHTFVSKRFYNVSLTVMDSVGNSAKTYFPVWTNNARPKVNITSPVPNLPGKVFQYSTNSTIVFDMSVVDDGNSAGISYQWEYKFVHNSHMHDKIGMFYTKTVSERNPPDESALERNNLKVVATATDAYGLSGTDYIMLSRPDWQVAFKGNRAPVVGFKYVAENARAGQPVTFDARQTFDPDGDYISFLWKWGDGLLGNGVVTTHTYDSANTNGFTVSLTATDNWGNSSEISMKVPIVGPQAITPSASLPAGPVYGPVNITLTSVESNAVIYFELFRGSVDNVDVTPCSTKYSGPITLPYTPGVTAHLLIKASTSGVPSKTVRYDYVMLEPPCNVLGFGAAGTTTAPGAMFCSNPVVVAPSEGVVDIPAHDATTNPYTENPPPDLTLVRQWRIGNLNGIPAPPGNLSELYNTTVPLLWVNGGQAAGACLKVEVDFDWTGDGTVDRRDVFTNIAPNDVAEDWENSQNFVKEFKSRFTGNPPTALYQNLVNGTVNVLFWEAIGDNNGKPDPIQVRTGAAHSNEKGMPEFSAIHLPYLGMYQFAARTPGAPLPGPPSMVCSGSGWQQQPTVNTAQPSGSQGSTRTQKPNTDPTDNSAKFLAYSIALIALLF